MSARRSSILALGDAAEALALRAVLETMHHNVRLFRPTAPSDVAPALINAATDDLVILSATGGPNGFLMSAHTASQSGLQDWLPANVAFAGVTFRDDSVLISTAAATRENGLVPAMVAAGGHLIAPNGTPERDMIVPWIGACLLGAQEGLAEAVMAANALVSPHNRFSYG